MIYSRCAILHQALLATLVFCVCVLTPGTLRAQPPGDKPPLSAETEACIACHESATPGIVADWRTSRHSAHTPESALLLPALERRVSAAKMPGELTGHTVGCYECHALRADKHADTFDHFGTMVHVVVTPADCQTCHPAEADQYSGSKKAHAHDNLVKNPVYSLLMETTLRQMNIEKGVLVPGKASENAKHETCLACHGTTVVVKGTKTVETDAGPIEIPDLVGWPNQGVGRINPDGSAGSCTACHPRHGFSIEVARKPETCGQCHLEPDVPGYNVYKESKHGNITDAKKERWTWDAVPWKLGQDFTAPSCATCHNALITAGGTVVAERTHNFGSRLYVRLFGLIYSHPQPISGKTHEILNADKMPLPVTFGGKPAASFLISPEEQATRKAGLKVICRNCHSTDWADKHFEKLDRTNIETDAMTATATKLLAGAWEKRIADGKNPFDEEIEQLWIKQWLFYANSVRSGSAMAGPDYAAFKHGWWDLTHNLQHMKELTGKRAGK